MSVTLKDIAERAKVSKVTVHKAIYAKEGVSGPELMELMRQQAVNFGTRVITDDIVEVQFGSHPFGLTASDGSTREALAVIVATGWEPYDATKLDNLGFGTYSNIITNMMMERLAAPNGPTQGKILRPADQKAPETVAFVQCAGSRDENHLPYCSYICCMASLKQTRYLREQDPDVNVTIFYIDIRTIGRLEDFYYDLLEDEKVTFVKGKVAGIEEASTPGNLVLDVEDTIAGRKPEPEFDMVVLATGIVPEIADSPIPFDLEMDPSERILVVSGPNTGGKTVTLSTIGLCALMAQAGFTDMQGVECWWGLRLMARRGA